MKHKVIIDSVQVGTNTIKMVLSMKSMFQIEKQPKFGHYVSRPRVFERLVLDNGDIFMIVGKDVTRIPHNITVRPLYQGPINLSYFSNLPIKGEMFGSYAAEGRGHEKT